MMIAGLWWAGVALAGDPNLGWVPGASPDEAGDVEMSLGVGAMVLPLYQPKGPSLTAAGVFRLRYSPARRLRLSLFGGIGDTPVGWPPLLGTETGGHPVAGGGGTVVVQVGDGDAVRASVWTQGGVVVSDLELKLTQGFVMPGVSLELGRRRLRFVAAAGLPFAVGPYVDFRASAGGAIYAAALGAKWAYDDGGSLTIGKIGPGLGVQFRKPLGPIFVEVLASSLLQINVVQVSVGWTGSVR